MIKNKFILRMLLLTTLSSLVGCLGRAERTLPENWYQLTDDGRIVEDEEESIYEQKTAEVFDTILDANANIFEDLDKGQKIEASSSGKPKDWVPWHLGGFITDLSVSAGGVLGYLVMNGAPSIQLNWARSEAKTDKSNFKISATRSNSFSALTIHPSNDPGEMNRQLEFVINTGIKSGKISDKEKFRKNVLNSSEQFFYLASQFSKVGPTMSNWSFDIFRLDVGIDISGEIVPTTSAGMAITFRLEWDRLKDRNITAPVNRAKGKLAQFTFTTLEKDLGQLVNTLVSDFDEIAFYTKGIQATGFDVSSIRVGLGISSAGDVGIVRGTVSSMGSMIFNKIKAPSSVMKSGLSSQALVKTINLIDESNNIKSVQSFNKLDRNAFRKGLRKAARIGGFFASRVSLVKSRSWKVSSIYSEFDIGATGTMGLVTTSGIGALEIDYVNLNF